MPEENQSIGSPSSDEQNKLSITVHLSLNKHLVLVYSEVEGILGGLSVRTEGQAKRLRELLEDKPIGIERETLSNDDDWARQVRSPKPD